MTGSIETRLALAGIVLAGGGSSRLGQPKQLVVYAGQPLVARAADLALTVCDAGVVVVTGAHADQVGAALRNTTAAVARCAKWQQGMAESIRTGVQAHAAGNYAGLLITVCDQPHVGASDLSALATAWQAAPTVPAAARYGDTIGVPAIIPAGMVDELVSLSGDAGAKSLLQAMTVTGIDMPNAAFDIDTQADLAKLTTT